MIEMVSSVASAVTNRASGMVTRSSQVLMKSSVTWLAVVSLSQRRQPGRVLQAAVDWAGIHWAVQSITTWLHDRRTATEVVGILFTFVAVSGIRLGAASWQSTRGPLGLTIGILLLLESNSSPLMLTAALFSGPLLAVIRERSVDSGLVVVISPLLALSAPLGVLAELFGFRERLLEDIERLRVRNTSMPSGSSGRSEPQHNPDRIHPPEIRPYDALKWRTPDAVAQLRPGPEEFSKAIKDRPRRPAAKQ
ncbi:hypothetical protein ACFV9C_32750 [Kribbella sp. NPDC059898]|uniref:hypothetical protein n=1 Tax=Kribbella sp. NPDC059898 TaxID=3346995 RepID=UPI003646DEF8